MPPGFPSGGTRHAKHSPAPRPIAFIEADYPGLSGQADNSGTKLPREDGVHINPVDSGEIDGDPKCTSTLIMTVAPLPRPASEFVSQYGTVGLQLPRHQHSCWEMRTTSAQALPPLTPSAWTGSRCKAVDEPNPAPGGRF